MVTSKKTSLADKIYLTIKKAIVNRELPPGTKLSEEVLASILNASRTPIRSALQRLSYEKLVDISPRKGASVSSPSVKEVQEVFEMRTLLEEFTVERACSNYRNSPRVSETLETILKIEEEAYRNKDVSEVLVQVRNFHLEIAKLCGNELIVRHLEELILLTNLYITFFSELDINSPYSPQEHIRILKAIQSGDAQTAKRELRSHIDGIVSRLNFHLIKNLDPNLQDILLKNSF